MLTRPEFIEGAGGGGKGGGGGSPRAAVEAPNTAQSKSIARVVDVLCEGRIQGLVNAGKSVFFDNTPLIASDGTENFQGVLVEFRDGTPEQTFLPGFPDVENEQSVGVIVKKSLGPIIRTITNSSVNRVRFTIRYAQMTSQNIENGDLNGASVRYQLSIKAQDDADFVLVKDRTASFKTTSPFEEAFSFPLNGTSPWQLKVERITADSQVISVVNAFSFARFTEIIDGKFEYPDTALIGIQVDSSLFGGNIPTRAYDLNGLIVQIPSNYDPLTRIYTGMWDGTFQLAWTDNPAWCLYDLLLNSRYGTGDLIKSGQLDKFAFFDIGQFCDELVDDGFGGLEPRYTLNVYLATRESVFNVINTLVSNFRGMAFWSAGQIALSIDRRADPELIVTPANVIGGQFTYSTASLKSRHTSAFVTWNDPNDAFKPAIEVVEDPPRIDKFGLNVKSILAVGATRRGQAHRQGKWLLFTELFENETVNYRAGLDHAFLSPGAIIEVQDPSFFGARFGGRLLETSPQGATLDGPVSLKTGESYILSVMLPDGTITAGAISDPAGTISVITLNVPWTTEPSVGAIWTVTGSEVTTRLFRVLGVSEESPGVFAITALEYNPDKFDIVEKDLTFDPNPVTRFPTGEIEPPQNVQIQESLFLLNNIVGNKLTMGWQVSTDQRVLLYEIQYRRTDNNWITAGSTASNSFEIDLLQPDIYEFRVTSISTIGRSIAAALTFTVQGKLQPPGDVTGLTAISHVEGIELTWNRVTDLDLTGYEIRIGGPASGFDDAILHEEFVVSTNIFIPSDTSVEQRFFVRAKDTSDVFSVVPAQVNAAPAAPPDVVDFDAIPQLDNVFFQWTPIVGFGIEYIIRRGATFETGIEIARVAGASATVAVPGGASAIDNTFFIKAVSPQGLLSLIARFTTLSLLLFADRNVVLLEDNTANNYAGVTSGMVPGIGTTLVLEEINGVFASHGEHYFNVDLGSVQRARSFVDVDLVGILGNSPTWDQATFTWDSAEALGIWGPSNSVEGAIIRRVIATELTVIPTEIIEAFSFNEITVGVNATVANTEANITFAGARFAQGIIFDDLTKLDYLVALPEEFTFTFSIVMDTTVVSDDVIFAQLENTTSGVRLEVGFDNQGATPKFFVRRQDNQVGVEVSIIFDAIDFLFIAITQDATDLGIYVRSAKRGTEDFQTIVLPPIGTWDKVFMTAA